MTENIRTRPHDKIAAVIAAVPLIVAETALNAEHLAQAEGWMSTLVLGAVGATLAAAAALPIAERAAVRGYWLKAIGLGLFFATMLAFSFTTSVSRVGSKMDGEIAEAGSHNGKLILAGDAYHAAQEAQKTECATGRGSRCRDAEKATGAARLALAAAPAPKTEDAMTRRLASVTGLSKETVQLYQPLLFPLALQWGGFMFLAYGLAPRRKEKVAVAVEPITIEPEPTKKAKPKAVRKKKLKQITYQPAISAKVDGRTIAGRRRKLANDDADFVPAFA
jgi:hypothetical protein